LLSIVGVAASLRRCVAASLRRCVAASLRCCPLPSRPLPAARCSFCPAVPPAVPLPRYPAVPLPRCPAAPLPATSRPRCTLNAACCPLHRVRLPAGPAARCPVAPLPSCTLHVQWTSAVDVGLRYCVAPEIIPPCSARRESSRLSLPCVWWLVLTGSASLERVRAVEKSSARTK
jgi:hypothetical protein